MQFQGPLGTAESSDELAQAIAKFDREDHSAAVQAEKMLMFSSVVDFEHLSLGEYDEGESAEEDEEDDDSGDDEENSKEDGGAKGEHAAEALKHRRLMDRKQALEARYRREQHNLKQKKYALFRGGIFFHE